MRDEGNRHKNQQIIEKGKIHVRERYHNNSVCVCVCVWVGGGLLSNEGINQKSLSDCQMIDQ